jgi:hypothetical protein
MKALRIVVCGLMFASVSVYAADKQSSTTPTAQKNQQAQSKSKKNPNYTWQDCVNDMEKEGGHSRDEAYKLCQDMQ